MTPHAVKMIRFTIEMRVFAEPSGELLATERVASTEEAAIVVARVIDRHGCQPLRIEHALSRDSIVVQHFVPELP